MNDFFEKNLDVDANARNAALMLYTMSQADRTWVLNQLPADQVSRLKLLLSELVTLGIPSDPKLLRHFVKEESNQVQADRDGPILRNEIIEQIDACNAEQIFQVLKNESVSLIASFLHLYSWSWHSEFIEHFDLPRQRDISEMLIKNNNINHSQKTKLGLKFKESLLREVFIRIEQTEVNDKNPQTLSVLNELKRNFMSLRNALFSSSKFPPNY